MFKKLIGVLGAGTGLAALYFGYVTIATAMATSTVENIASAGNCSIALQDWLPQKQGASMRAAEQDRLYYAAEYAKVQIACAKGWAVEGREYKTSPSVAALAANAEIRAKAFAQLDKKLNPQN